MRLVLAADNLLEKEHFILVGHLHVEYLATCAILSRQVKHLHFVLDHVLRKHAVTEVFDVASHVKDRVRRELVGAALVLSLLLFV